MCEKLQAKFARYSISFYRLAVKRSALSASSFASRSTFYARFHDDGKNRKLFVRCTKRSILPRDRSVFKSARIIQFLPVGDRALRRSIPTYKNGEGKKIQPNTASRDDRAEKFRNNRMSIAIYGSFPRFTKISFRMWTLLGWFATIKSMRLQAGSRTGRRARKSTTKQILYIVRSRFLCHILRSNHDRRCQQPL